MGAKKLRLWMLEIYKIILQYILWCERDALREEHGSILTVYDKLREGGKEAENIRMMENHIKQIDTRIKKWQRQVVLHGP